MYCTNCENRLDNNAKFCSSCGAKQEIQNFQSNNINSKKKNKLTKILGICAGISFGLSIVILFLGVILCFPDPLTDNNISGLSFDSFGACAGTMIIVGVILIISVIVLNIVKLNKRSC